MSILEEDSLTIVLFIVYVLSPLIVSGGITGIIALAKGRSFGAWFFYGFFVPLFSQLHVIFCERKKQETPPNPPPLIIPESVKSDEKSGEKIPTPPLSVSVNKRETYWLPVLSLTTGIFCSLAFIDTSLLAIESVCGQLFFSAGSIVLGIRSICTQRKGRIIAIIGVVIGILTGIGGVNVLSTMLT